MLWHEGTSLYDQDNFYGAFLKDITPARKRVVIESPFMTTRRVCQLVPIFSKLVRHGVKVVINTKPFEEHDALLQDMSHESVGMLQDIGVQVLMTVGHHRKLAIIDDTILWEGSLNILSQNDSCEMMRRIYSEDAIKQMLRFLHLDRFYGLE